MTREQLFPAPIRHLYNRKTCIIILAYNTIIFECNLKHLKQCKEVRRRKETIIAPLTCVLFCKLITYTFYNKHTKCAGSCFSDSSVYLKVKYKKKWLYTQQPYTTIPYVVICLRRTLFTEFQNIQYFTESIEKLHVFL